MIQVTRNDWVELESYQLKDVAHIWWLIFGTLNGRRTEVQIWPLLVRNVFETFFYRFLPIEMREARSQELMKLR